MHDEVKSIKSGKYTLVARLYEGNYHGFLWANGKVIENDLASSLEDAWREVCSRLYEHLSKDAESHCNVPYTAANAKQAFLNIAPRLSTGHKSMLRQHLNTKDRCITATELAKAANYKGYTGANLQYGLIGAMLYGEMPQVLPQRSDGSPIMTFVIADGDAHNKSPEDQWIWQMREHIAEGLAASGIL